MDLNLTPAQEKLFRALACGTDLKRSAAGIGISHGTARAHIWHAMMRNQMSREQIMYQLGVRDGKEG